MERRPEGGDYERRGRDAEKTTGRAVGERKARPTMLRSRSGGEAQIGQAIEQRVDGDARFEAGEMGASAEVAAEAEGEVFLGAPRQLEAIGIDEVGGIAVRRAEREQDLRAGGQLDAGQHGRLRRLARSVLYRRFPAQRFVDRPFDLLAIGAHVFERGRVVEQGVERIADQTERRLRAGRQQQAQEAEDLLVGQPLPVDLGMDETAHQVAGRLGTALRQERAQKLDQILCRLVAARRIVREADDVESPMVKRLVVLHRNPDHVGDDADRDRRSELRDEVGANRRTRNDR